MSDRRGKRNSNGTRKKQKERDEAYERAAMIAEQHFIYGHAVAGPSFAAKCAKKIRALKSKTNL